VAVFGASVPSGDAGGERRRAGHTAGQRVESSRRDAAGDADVNASAG
jgi:hypothetical protein